MGKKKIKKKKDGKIKVEDRTDDSGKDEKLKLPDFFRINFDAQKEIDLYAKKSKSEEEECITSLFHKCQFKRLLDDGDGGLKIKGNFIVFTFHAKYMDGEDKGALNFGYRINHMTQPNESILLRSSQIVWECSSNTSYVSKSIFDVLIPLETTAIFQKYPFTIYKAEVLIRLATKICGEITFRPDIAISTNDLSQNVTVTPVKELDRSKNYDFITTCPSVKYFMDCGKNCNEFSVDFLLVDDGLKKFYKFCFPLFLVCIISTVNALVKPEENDYLGISSAMALAVVILLPDVAESTTNQFHLSFNALNVILICLGLALASIPPSIDYFPFYKIGIFFLWLSFGIPIYNYCSYHMVIREMEKSCCEAKHYTGVKKFHVEKNIFEEGGITGKFVHSLEDNFKYPNDKEIDNEQEIMKKKKAVQKKNLEVNGSITEKDTVEGRERNSLVSSIINIVSSCRSYNTSNLDDDCETNHELKGSVCRHSSAVEETSYLPLCVLIIYILVLYFSLNQIFKSNGVTVPVTISESNE